MAQFRMQTFLQKMVIILHPDL